MNTNLNTAQVEVPDESHFGVLGGDIQRADTDSRLNGTMPTKSFILWRQIKR